GEDGADRPGDAGARLRDGHGRPRACVPADRGRGGGNRLLRADARAGPGEGAGGGARRDLRGGGRDGAPLPRRELRRVVEFLGYSKRGRRGAGPAGDGAVGEAGWAGAGARVRSTPWSVGCAVPPVLAGGDADGGGTADREPGGVPVPPPDRGGVSRRGAVPRADGPVRGVPGALGTGVHGWDHLAVPGNRRYLTPLFSQQRWTSPCVIGSGGC